MDGTEHPDRSAPHARLTRGAGLLIALLWALHFSTLWVRSQFDRTTGEWRFDGEATLRRLIFSLFGAFIAYMLYLCLRRLRERDFARQATIGGALALIAAGIQASGNFLFIDPDLVFMPTFLFSLLYWFWFYFSVAAAYLALSYSVTVQEQQRQAAELAVKARDAQVRALRYQINPHFLFNTLNAIAALVRDAPAQAEEMVVRLSDFFRRSLAIDPMDDVTLAEEVELQRLYLEIERTRFPDRLRFEVELDEDAGAVPVPPLLLQPLIENAVKHGVARSQAPTSIRIRARVDGPVLEIVVENDARAEGPASAGEKVGLRNVAERLRSRFGDEAAINAGAMPGGGYRNRLLIPLRR
jgi:hypothetical protein